MYTYTCIYIYIYICVKFFFRLSTASESTVHDSVGGVCKERTMMSCLIQRSPAIIIFTPIRPSFFSLTTRTVLHAIASLRASPLPSFPILASFSMIHYLAMHTLDPVIEIILTNHRLHCHHPEFIKIILYPLSADFRVRWWLLLSLLL